MTPLLSSMLNKKCDILKVILTKFERKVKINYQFAKNVTPLHILCTESEHSLTEGEKMFLSLKDLKLNEQESVNLYSPLHLAVLCNKQEIVKILLDNPQVDVNIKDIKKNTPLHYAFPNRNDYQENFEILKLFLNSSNKKLDLMPTNSSVFILFILFLTNNLVSSTSSGFC